MDDSELQRIEEPYFNWRALAGYAYILICLVDFLIMPVAVHFNRVDTKNAIQHYLEVTEDKKFVLELIDRTNTQMWEPVTLFNGGLFHLSFGAILTGAAVTRGFERREIVKRNGK